MQLVEQHIINPNDPRYAAIDAAAFASKNLYNAANYELRQAFIHEGRFLPYNQLDKLMQSHEAYRALPAKVAQWVLKGLVNNWKSFFEARESYQINADLNGAYNIIRKVAPDAFSEARAVEDGKGMLASLVVHPVRIVVPLKKPKDRHFVAKASGH